MNRNLAIARLPRLYDAGGDLSKDWEVQYHFRDPNTGKMKRFKIIGGLSKIKPDTLKQYTEQHRRELRNERYATANKIIEEITEKLRGGYNPFKDTKLLFEENIGTNRKQRSVRTIETFLREAGEICMEGRSYGSVKNYNAFLNNFIEWIKARNMNSFPITAINHAHVEKFLVGILQQGHSNKWRNEHLSFLRKVWKQVVKMHPTKVTHNPFELSDKLKHTRKKSPTYQPAMRKKIRALLPKFDPQLWLFIQCVYYTGLRPGKELLLTQIKHLDLIMGTWRIPAENTKDTTERSVTIPAQLLKEFKRLKLDKLNSEFFLFTSRNRPGPIKMSESYYRNRWMRFKNHHNIPEEFSVYAFKHTGATAARKAGIDIHKIKDQLGHSSVQQTEEYLDAWKNDISEEIRDEFPTL